MSTLKFRNAHGYAYVCDVKAIEMGTRWRVPAAKFDRPDSAQTETSAFAGLNTIGHAMPCLPHDAPPDHALREDWECLELLVRRLHGSGHDSDRYEVHLVPAGECWLMGDDGRTIDRIF